MNDDTTRFTESLWGYYGAHGRSELPWRQTEPGGGFDPYKILVSEIMLQQTQVRRVIPKFHEFLKQFPTLGSLSQAPLSAVITAWSGLGYNRRAKYLHQSAQLVSNQLSGIMPDTIEGLVLLPGVGKNTAGAIMAYAYNQPALFIETNVRTVYIHHFYNNQVDIADSAIMVKLEMTMDHSQPREFYWALMDYGSHLKQTIGNYNRLSKTYTKQPSFVGSRRQLRGQILRGISMGRLTIAQLQEEFSDDRLISVLDDLCREQLIAKIGNYYELQGFQ